VVPEVEFLSVTLPLQQCSFDDMRSQIYIVLWQADLLEFFADRSVCTCMHRELGGRSVIAYNIDNNFPQCYIWDSLWLQLRHDLPCIITLNPLLVWLLYLCIVRLWACKKFQFCRKLLEIHCFASLWHSNGRWRISSSIGVKKSKDCRQNGHWI